MTGATDIYRILVVEDNPGDYVLVEDFLWEQFKEPKITGAKNFAETKSLLKDHFDIILLDLSLPDKTRESLIPEVLELAQTTPVIVLTGYNDFDFGVKSLSMGVADYLLKDDLTADGLYKSIVYALERRKTTKALEESEQKYSELFHLSPSPLMVFDLETYDILNVNNAAVNLYGYTYDEFLKLTIMDIRPPEEIERLKKALKESNNFAPETLAKSYFYSSHRKKDGEIMTVDIRGNNIFYKNRRARLVLIIDITERLKYISDIEQQNEKLREISWMQSHLVRAPLARIMGLSELLLGLGHAEADVAEIINYIGISANELDQIVRDITAKSSEAIVGNYNKITAKKQTE